jgi:hypothetical protein
MIPLFRPVTERLFLCFYSNPRAFATEIFGGGRRAVPRFAS